MIWSLVEHDDEPNWRVGMTARLILATAVGDYAHTRPLRDGTIGSDRLRLEHVDISPVNRAFRPMANDLAFDVCEMAIVTYILARAMGRPLAGIPVILHRASPFEAVVCRAAAGIRGPKDLEGKRVGVRSYTQTTGVWLRGILESEFGVDLDSIHWLTSEGAHVDGFVDPPNVSRIEANSDLADMLVAGEIDAAVGVSVPANPEIHPLFADPVEAESAWSRRTGLTSVNHILTVREELAVAHPWLKGALFDLFEAARVEANRRTGGAIPAFGVEANRASIVAVSRFAHAQGIAPREFSPEELFTP
jgi:4,5-dihydroxyphthalate decarboxylase